MRGWMMGAALLLGLAQGGAAVAAAAANAAPQRSERSSTPSSDAQGHPPTQRQRDRDGEQDRDPQRDQEKDRDLRDQATRQGQAPASDREAPTGTTPASSPPAPAQPVFIISCNASGCNDNQGNFLTRSGPQRLVGPKGISCQLMGGNWQCSPGSAP